MATRKKPKRRPEKPSRVCPKCHDGLNERPLKESGIRIDACPTCHGLWFDRWELEGHLGAPDFVPSGNSSVSGRSCPACRLVMTSFKPSNTDVTIDMCEECKGIWLDAGELKRLEEAARPPSGFLAGLMKLLGI